MYFRAFLLATIITLIPSMIFAGSQQTSSTTVGTIVDDVRYYLNDTTEDFWTNDELIRWMNAGIINIAARTECLDKIETIALVQDQLEYLITEDYITVKSVKYNKDKGLIMGSPIGIGHCADLAEPTYWYEWNNKVGIYPVFDVTEHWQWESGVAILWEDGEQMDLE